MFGFGKQKQNTPMMFPPPPPPAHATGGPFARNGDAGFTATTTGNIAVPQNNGADAGAGTRTLPPSLPPRKNFMRKASQAVMGFNPMRKSSVPGPPPMRSAFFGFFGGNATAPATRSDLESIPPPPPPGRAGPGNAPPFGATPQRKGTIPLPPPPRFRKKAAPPPPASMMIDGEIPGVQTGNAGNGMLTRLKSSLVMARGSIPLPPPPRRRYKGGMGPKRESSNYIGDPPQPNRQDTTLMNTPVAPPRDFPPPASLAVNGGITIPPPPPRAQKKKANRRPSISQAGTALGGLRRFASNMKLAAKETMYGFGDAVRPPPPPPSRSKSGGASQTSNTARRVAAKPVKPAPVRGAFHKYGEGSLKRLDMNGGGSKPGTLKRVNSGTSQQSGQRDWVKVENKGWARASTLEGNGPIKPWNMRKTNTVDNGQVSRYNNGTQNGTWKKTTVKPKAGTLGRPKKHIPMPDPTFAPYGSRVNSTSSKSSTAPDPANLTWKSDPEPGLRRFESRFDFWFKREGTLKKKW